MITRAGSTICDIRNATVDDAEAIHKIISEYVEDGLLLPRPVEDIISRIGNFKVASDQNNQIVACGALRDFGNSLYEIRSLAVKKGYHAGGIGSQIVRELLEYAVERAGGHARVFALTFRISFFEHLNFVRVDKHIFPEKIWADCIYCKNKDQCGEIAVAIEVQ